MTSNKYYRDPNDVSKQLRPGRFDPRILDYTPNAGDGIPGLQWIIQKLLGQLLIPRFVIEGCSWAGGTLSQGYIMWNGKVVVVESQGVAVTNDEWLFIDSTGTGIATAVEATAKAGVMIVQDIGGTPYDIRFRQINNVLQIYGLNIQDNVDILGDLDVDGVANLDNVDIDGTLDVLGVGSQQLPSLVNIDYRLDRLVNSYATEIGLDRNVPWFIGAGDGACSSLGSGCLGHDKISIMVGTVDTSPSVA